MRVNFKILYSTLNRKRLLNNFPKFHASTYTWSWRIHDDSVFNIRKKLLLGPRPPVSVNLNILFTCYNHGSVLINYSEFHASTYTGNMIICDFLFLYSSFKEKLHLGPRPPVFDYLNIFCLLTSRKCTQQLPKVSCFCLLAKYEN